MPVDLRQIGVTLLIWFSLVTGLPAQEPESLPAGTKQEDTTEPTMEFLEFLADWETEEGQWIDPEEVEQWALPETSNHEDEEERDTEK